MLLPSRSQRQDEVHKDNVSIMSSHLILARGFVPLARALLQWRLAYTSFSRGGECPEEVENLENFGEVGETL